MSDATLACPHCGAISSASAELCYNCGGDLHTTAASAASLQQAATSAARTESTARRYATTATFLLAGLFLCSFLGSAFSSFDAPGPAWIESALQFGPVWVVAFVVFFSGVGVGIYRSMAGHEWSAWGNVAIIAAATVGGFVAGLWLSQSFLGSSYQVPASARMSFGLAGSAALAIGSVVMIWLRNRRWKAVRRDA